MTRSSPVPAGSQLLGAKQWCFHRGVSSCGGRRVLCHLQGGRTAACPTDKTLEHDSLLTSLLFFIYLFIYIHFLYIYIHLYIYILFLVFLFGANFLIIFFFFIPLISLIGRLRIPSKSNSCFQFADLTWKLIIALTKACPVPNLSGGRLPSTIRDMLKRLFYKSWPGNHSTASLARI